MKLRILISSKVLKSNINIRSVCQFTAYKTTSSSVPKIVANSQLPSQPMRCRPKATVLQAMHWQHFQSTAWDSSLLTDFHKGGVKTLQLHSSSSHRDEIRCNMEVQPSFA